MLQLARPEQYYGLIGIGKLFVALHPPSAASRRSMPPFPLHEEESKIQINGFILLKWSDSHNFQFFQGSPYSKQLMIMYLLRLMKIGVWFVRFINFMTNITKKNRFLLCEFSIFLVGKQTCQNFTYAVLIVY